MKHYDWQPKIFQLLLIKWGILIVMFPKKGLPNSRFSPCLLRTLKSILFMTRKQPLRSFLSLEKRAGKGMFTRQGNKSRYSSWKEFQLLCEIQNQRQTLLKVQLWKFHLCILTVVGSTYEIYCLLINMID